MAVTDGIDSWQVAPTPDFRALSFVALRPGCACTLSQAMVLGCTHPQSQGSREKIDF